MKSTLLTTAVCYSLWMMVCSHPTMAQTGAAEKQERLDRLVDRAALHEVNRAIESTTRQLKKTKSSPTKAQARAVTVDRSREELLLFKLGDLQHQKAELEFRVGMHSKSDSQYRKALEESVRTLTEVANRFPETEEMPRLLFLRARAFSDLEKPGLAEKDYLKIISKYPDFDQLHSTRVALAGIYTERADHESAISALKPIRTHPESEFYPHALQQLAWSWFNLKNYDEAIEASFEVVKHLSSQIQKKKASITDSSVMERSMMDIATFFGDATEQDPSRYTTDRAWKLFNEVQHVARLDESAGLLSMSVRLAKLFRSKALDKELRDWSAILWKERPRADATLTVDFLLREFADLQSDWKTSLEAPPFEKSGLDFKHWEPHRKLYSQIQTRIHELLQKNPNAPTEKTLPWLLRLEQAYDVFLAITPKDSQQQDPRIAQAELQLLKVQLAVLSQKNLRIKFEIGASSKPSTSRRDPNQNAAYAPILNRMDRILPGLTQEQAVPLLLERSKMLYELGERQNALEGFERVTAVRTRKTGQAEVRAALAALLDQSLLDEDRARLETLISRRREFKDDPAALALLDKAELERDVLVLKKPKETKEKLSAIDRLITRKDLPSELEDYVLAEKAALLRAQVEPHQLTELLSLLSRQSKPQLNAAPILLLSFSEGKESDWLSKPGFCADKQTRELCSQLIALRELDQPIARTQALPHLKTLLKASSAPDRAIRALRLLTHARSLGYKDRNSVLRLVAKGWKDLHPVLQWQLLPRWLRDSKQALSEQQIALRHSSPISVPHQASEPHLVHRMDLIKSFENLAKDLSEMGLLETVIVAFEIQAAITADFKKDLEPITQTAGAPAEILGLMKGLTARTEALAKTALEEKAKLTELELKTAQKLAAPEALTLARGFEAAKVSSQVWAFIKSPEWDAQTRNQVVARILWAQGARHAAGQL